MKFNPTLHKLSNGVTVILDPMDIETVSMKIRINGGARIEQSHEYGITHFLEHMMFQGNSRYESEKVMHELLNDNGGTYNASTGLAATAYYGRILAENFSILLDVLSEMVLNPNMAQENIEKERGVIIQEIKRSQDNESRKFNDVVNRNIFPGSYLARYDTLGSFDTLATLNHDNLMKYKNEKYTANNIVIGISGKIFDINKILNDLESVFGRLKSGENISVDPGKVNPSIVYDVRDDKKQTRVFIGCENGYPDTRKFDYESMCLSVFETALSRRLFNYIRDEKGLVYEIGGSGYGDRYIGVNGIMTALAPEKVPDMIAGVASICFDILHNKPVTLEELNRKNTMKKLARADFLESAGGRRDQLISFYANYGDLYNPAEFDALRMRMTVDDIMKYSASYFDAPLNIIAQGPKCDIDMKAIWIENFK